MERTILPTVDVQCRVNGRADHPASRD